MSCPTRVSAANWRGPDIDTRPRAVRKRVDANELGRNLEREFDSFRTLLPHSDRNDFAAQIGYDGHSCFTDAPCPPRVCGSSMRLVSGRMVRAISASLFTTYSLVRCSRFTPASRAVEVALLPLRYQCRGYCHLYTPPSLNVLLATRS